MQVKPPPEYQEDEYNFKVFDFKTRRGIDAKLTASMLDNMLFADC